MSSSSPLRPMGSTFIQSILFSFICIFLSLPNHVIALGVQITQPPPDSTFTAGPFNVSWTDAGGSPDMSELTTYNLQLIVGGNRGDADSRVIQTLVNTGSVATGSATVNISSDIAQSIQNGFYLRMTSNASDGRIVLNYSGRFTLLQMTGATDAVYIQGAAAFVGGTNVPSTQVNVPINESGGNNGTSSSNSSTPNSTGSSSPAETTSSAAQSSSIDTGVVAGVAVVGVLVGIALVAMSWWLWAMRQRRQTRRQEKQRNLDTNNGTSFGGKAELPSHSADSSVASTPVGLHDDNPVELAERRKSDRAYEMDGRREQDSWAEMESPTVVHELEGEWTGWEMSSARRSKLQSYDPTR